MHAVQLIYRAELRRRWRSWLALALLVALAGGSVMAAVAAGRRTSSAFPSFVARYGYDALLESVKPLPSVIALPEVESAMELPAFGNGTLSIGREQVSGGDVTFLGLPELQPWPIVKLVAGRMPLASDPTGVLASVTAEQFGVHLGSIITMPMYSSTQHSALSAPAGSIPPHGPTVHLVVVGIEADAVDFPSGTPFFSVFAGPAFERTFGPRLLLATATLVRLRHGSADVSRFSEQFEHLAAGNGYAENVDALEATVQQTITPQVTGWNLLALLAALAALAVVGQAFGRQSAAQVESYPTLRALGVRPAELFRLGVVSATSIGLLGAVGAVGLAWALSPLTPLGVARLAAPSTGFEFDPLVLGVGAIGVVLLCVALGALPAWRSSRALGDGRRLEPASARGSAVFARWRAGASGLPSALVGTRRALQRGTGGAALPVGTALLGSSLAVTALVATAVFGAGLSNLTRTPALYGQVEQLTLANGLTGVQVQSILPAITAERAIDRVSYGVLGPFLSIRGVTVTAILAEDLKGPLNFAVVSGRLPHDDGQIALGNSTLRQVGAHVGSVIPVTIATPAISRTAELRVVGTTSFAPVLDSGGLGDGAVLTLGAGIHVLCGSGAASATCQKRTAEGLSQVSGWGILISAVPGPAGRAAISSIARRYAASVNLPIPPTDLVNFGEAVNFPLLFGIALALFGAATFTHLLVASVTRRRRDVALLKALGFVRRQVAAAVCWQATTVAVVAVAFGVPVGIALGRVVWRTFAFNLGAVPVDVVPGWLVVGLAAGVLVAANVLAGLPAVGAARLKPSEALRQA
jgi:ABC-type lipoprotein release transport system permease subunit